MGKETGFKEFPRNNGSYQPADTRINDYSDIFIPVDEDEMKVQASRCMDCGIPFCSSNCPLGNIIPDFNDLVYNGQWKKST